MFLIILPSQMLLDWSAVSLVHTAASLPHGAPSRPNRVNLGSGPPPICASSRRLHPATRRSGRRSSNTPNGAWVTYTYDSTANGNMGVGRVPGEHFSGPANLSGSYSDAPGEQTL